MTEFFFGLLFIFGLIIGSFLNVLVFRYDPAGKLFDGKKLGGRSHCPHCSHQLGASELVPLWSFFIQKGKCRECGHKLSFQYPILEFLSGAVFAGVPFFVAKFYELNISYFANFRLEVFYYILAILWIIAFLTWLIIAVIDLRQYVVPNELNVLLAVLGIITGAVLIIYAGKIFPFRESFLEQYQLVFSPFGSLILNRILGMFAGGLFFGLLVFLSRGRGMGMGDVKLAAASGLLLGWPDIALAAIIAFILGGLIGGLFLALGKKTMKDRLPFAPFFVVGIFMTILFGQAVISGYFSLFNI
jgi:leader peptidase (prepilin peptidase)/N-methyltransferase